MDRRTARPAVLAALALFAVAAAAATLPTAVPGGRGSGESLFGVGSGGGSLFPVPERVPEPTPLFPIAIPEELAMALGLGLLAVLAAFAVLYRRRALEAALAVLVLVLLVGLGFLLAALLEPFATDVAGGGIGLSGGTPGSSAEGQPRSPPTLAVLLLAAALVGAVVVLVGSERARDLVSPGGDDDGEEATITAVGRSAGRAADRIEGQGDLDNEVYRAWREMTGLLAVERPSSTTPGEFARAAVDAGMAPDDVAELTRLFEDVRYGGEEPTAGYERRALAILRHVEETYASEGGVEG